MASKSGVVVPPASSVGARLGADFLAASIAGLGVSPIVSAVDKALAENASGREKLWTSFGKSMGEFVRQPIKVSPPLTPPPPRLRAPLHLTPPRAPLTPRSVDPLSPSSA